MKVIKVRSSRAGLWDKVEPVHFLNTLKEDYLQSLTSDLKCVVLRKGETLFRQGDPSDAIYFVLKGLLQAAITQENGNEIVVGEIQPGEPVGEMQIFAGGKRNARIYAIRNSELLKLPKAEFERLAIKKPKLVRRMASISRRRLRRNQLATILFNFLGRLDQVDLQDIEAHVEWVYLKRGEVLFRQGEVGDSLSVVISGLLLAVHEDL